MELIWVACGFFQGQMPRLMVSSVETSHESGHTKVAIGNMTKGCFTAASSANHAASALQDACRELETRVKYSTGSKHSCVPAKGLC